MSIAPRRIMPCLLFDTQAEEAARFYVSVFKNARIGRISHYGKAGTEVRGRAEGTVMTVEFELDGQAFFALNGPRIAFTEAVSFTVYCDTQDEVDHYWSRLSAGGSEGPCGWLKDKFGLSWQITPARIPDMITDPDRSKADRVLAAVMQMKKLDIATLERAYAGG